MNFSTNKCTERRFKRTLKKKILIASKVISTSFISFCFLIQMPNKKCHIEKIKIETSYKSNTQHKQKTS